MPTSIYIIDTNLAAQADANTYATMSEVQDVMWADWDYGIAGAGQLKVKLRCSSGIPYSGPMEIGAIAPTAGNSILVEPEIVNGFPFEQIDDDANTANLISITGPNIFLKATEKGAWLSNPSQTNTNKRDAISMAETSHIDGLIINGGVSEYIGGIGNASADSTVKNTVIIGCNQEFTGAIRDYSGQMSFDAGLIKDCNQIRSCGPITNSILVNANVAAGDGIHIGSNNNAYNVAKDTINYAGDGTNADADSFFSIDQDTELTLDPLGGYVVRATSPLATASSTGGVIGPFESVTQGLPPSISVYLSGNTLNAIVSDDTTVSPMLQLNINNSPVGSPQATPSWDMTSYGLGDGYHRITVTATDDDSNSDTSKAVFYSIGGIIGAYFIGNSLSMGGDPTSTRTGGNIADMTKAMFVAAGSDIVISTGLRGGSGFDVFVNDQEIMGEISSGDYTVVMMQTYLDENVAYYEQHLKPMVDATKGAGSDFTTWFSQVREDEQFVIDGYIARSREGCTAAGSNTLESARAWHSIIAADPTINLHGDNTHQNVAGLWISALCSYRYLSGNTANSVTYLPTQIQEPLGTGGMGLTNDQIQLIRDKVDQDITEFYVRSEQNTCSVTITEPSASAVVNEGDSVTFTAIATDSSTGDLSAGIEWKDGATVLHTGATFSTSVLPTGSRLITASRAGSDGQVSTAARSVQVNSLVNEAPVTVNSSRNIAFNQEFEQVPLAAFVTDDNDAIDWSTLVITQQPVNAAVSAVQDDVTVTTVNVNYSGTNYSGPDSFKYTVKDSSGLTSNEATVSLTVLPLSAASGAIANSTITRGLSFDIVMKDYIADGSVAFLEIFIKDDAGDGSEYECTPTLNTDGLIRATAPTTAVLAMALSGSQVLIKIRGSV